MCYLSINSIQRQFLSFIFMKPFILQHAPLNLFLTKSQQCAVDLQMRTEQRSAKPTIKWAKRIPTKWTYDRPRVRNTLARPFSHVPKWTAKRALFYIPNYIIQLATKCTYNALNRINNQVIRRWLLDCNCVGEPTLVQFAVSSASSSAFSTGWHSSRTVRE